MKKHTGIPVGLSWRNDTSRLPYEFSGGTRPITGGIACRAHIDGNGHPKPGTLGYIATKVSNGEQVILSCAHVLLNPGISERLVFQPDYSKCTGVYYHDVGTVADYKAGNFPVSGISGDFYIDAAIASIKSGVDSRRFIPNVGDITGSENLINAATTPAIRVKKMGSASGYTEGEISRVDLSQGPATGMIKIDPVAGHTYTYRERRKVRPEYVADVLVDFPNEAFNGTATLVDAAEGIVEFQSEVFAIPGDSGAQLVKTDGKIVGMILAGDMFEVPAFDTETQRWRVAGIPKGSAYACHIQPVLEQLGLRIDASSATTAGKPIIVPGNLIAAEDPDKYTRLSDKLEKMERELRVSKYGQEILNTIRTFFAEVAQLVHHTRPVKVTWHRYYGPSFIAAFFRSIETPDQPMPVEVEGVPVNKLLEKMEEAFLQNGSSALYKAVQQYKYLVYQLAGGITMNEFLFNLKSIQQTG